MRSHSWTLVWEILAEGLMFLFPGWFLNEVCFHINRTFGLKNGSTRRGLFRREHSISYLPEMLLTGGEPPAAATASAFLHKRGDLAVPDSVVGYTCNKINAAFLCFSVAEEETKGRKTEAAAEPLVCLVMTREKIP